MNVSDKTDFFKVVDNFAKTKQIESLCIFKADERYKANVTISIPTYKRVDTLRETLESALNQTGFDSYIIYVIDNNPERYDETEEFMQQYKGGRISYYKNAENLGLCGNWNRCISLPETEWVCLLHDDDTIDPIFMHTMTDYLAKLPNVGILQSRKYRQREHNYHEKYTLPYEKYSYLDFYVGNIIDVPTGIFFNKEKVISVGGFNEDYYPSLDVALVAFMSSEFNTFVVNQEITWYRESAGNVSKAIETQKGWFVVNYYLTKYLLKKAGLPKFIADVYTEYHCITRAKEDMARWGTDFTLPIHELPWKNHNQSLGRLFNEILWRYVGHKHYHNSLKYVK